MRKITVVALTLSLLAAIVVGLIHSRRYWSMIENNESEQINEIPESKALLPIANRPSGMVGKEPPPVLNETKPEPSAASEEKALERPRQIVSLKIPEPIKSPSIKIKKESILSKPPEQETLGKSRKVVSRKETTLPEPMPVITKEEPEPILEPEKKTSEKPLQIASFQKQKSIEPAPVKIEKEPILGKASEKETLKKPQQVVSRKESEPSEPLPVITKTDPSPGMVIVEKAPEKPQRVASLHKLKPPLLAPERIKREALADFTPQRTENVTIPDADSLKKMTPPEPPPMIVKTAPAPGLEPEEKAPEKPQQIVSLQDFKPPNLSSVNTYTIRSTPPPTLSTSILERAQKALREGIDPEEAVALAKSLPEDPDRYDAAFLLFEYAAESGNSEAALSVGFYYDPTNSELRGSIRKNPETAYKWYQTALADGRKEAKKHLTKLYQWVKKEASKGNIQAKDLLRNWR